MLSMLYAFIVIMLGICFPVSEAVIHSWNTHHVVGVSESECHTMK